MQENGFMSSSFQYSPKEYLHKEANREPWRLTSQPRPQGGHPPSSRKQDINSFMLHIHMPCICTIKLIGLHNIFLTHPSQGLAQRFNKWIKKWVELGSHHEEDCIAFKIHIFSISKCPFGAINMLTMPFWGNQYLTMPFRGNQHLPFLIPPYTSQDASEPDNLHAINIFNHLHTRENSSTPCVSPTNPFSPGISSLPRVSDASHPIHKTYTMKPQIQEDSHNTNHIQT